MSAIATDNFLLLPSAHEKVQGPRAPFVARQQVLALYYGTLSTLGSRTTRQRPGSTEAVLGQLHLLLRALELVAKVRSVRANSVSGSPPPFRLPYVQYAGVMLECQVTMTTTHSQPE